MKNGVKFGSKHSIDDWDLLMVSKDIESPEPKIITVEVPGADGTKDLSEIFGIKYYNRTLTFEFDIFAPQKKWWTLHQEISSYLHGKKHKIILDADSDFYYFGRCKILSFTNTYNVAHLIISCDCDPYKYKLEKTIDSRAIIANKTYSFFNLCREVVPEITVTSDTNFIFNGVSYSINAGTHKNLNIVFKQGYNNIKIISGSGNFIVAYQEATL